MPRLGPAKVGALLVFSLLVGSNLILPAGAHLTRRLPHLFRHLDPRYINTAEKAADAELLDGQDSSAFLGVNAKAADADLLDGQNSTAFLGVNAKAADADLLDGQDSTAFLGANAKAADADLLDGQNSTSFMAGPGKVVEGAETISPNVGSSVLSEAGFFGIGYDCPLALGNDGFLGFANHTGATINMFIDNGSASPSYFQLPADNTLTPVAAAAGEFLTIQVHGPNIGIATIHIMSVHRASDCHVQAQAVISS